MEFTTNTKMMMKNLCKPTSWYERWDVRCVDRSCLSRFWSHHAGDWSMWTPVVLRRSRSCVLCSGLLHRYSCSSVTHLSITDWCQSVLSIWITGVQMDYGLFLATDSSFPSFADDKCQTFSDPTPQMWWFVVVFKDPECRVIRWRRSVRL